VRGLINQTAMTKEKLQTAKEEALRFLKRVEELEQSKAIRTENNRVWQLLPKQQGAVRRASMDLTRALAELRKPD